LKEAVSFLHVFAFYAKNDICSDTFIMENQFYDLPKLYSVWLRHTPGQYQQLQNVLISL
jgi:hypothetical protein